MKNFLVAFEQQFQKINEGNFIAVVVESQFKEKVLRDLSEYVRSKKIPVVCHDHEPVECFESKNRLHLLKLKAKSSKSIHILVHEMENESDLNKTMNFIRANFQNGLEDACDILILGYQDSYTRIVKFVIRKYRGGECGEINL